MISSLCRAPPPPPPPPPSRRPRSGTAARVSAVLAALSVALGTGDTAGAALSVALRVVRRSLSSCGTRGAGWEKEPEWPALKLTCLPCEVEARTGAHTRVYRIAVLLLRLQGQFQALALIFGTEQILAKIPGPVQPGNPLAEHIHLGEDSSVLQGSNDPIYIFGKRIGCLNQEMIPSDTSIHQRGHIV